MRDGSLAPAPLVVAECTGSNAAWDAFVEAHPQASVFHLLEWRRIIVDAYRHRPYYLVASGPAGLEGVLPLVMIRSRLFGRSLVSLPFADYGGICASDAAVGRALLDRAIAIGRAEGAEYVQLRQREPHPALAGVPSDKVTMLLELDPDPQALWARLPSERRNRIKKARSAGVRGRLTDGDALEAFYGVFSENMRDLGSPVHGRPFFRAILDALGPRARVLLIERAGEVIGAAVTLWFRDTVCIPWVSSRRSHFALNPNMVLYWTAIEEACARGCRILDFGRSSPGTGTFEFKRQWGATPRPLAWSTFPRPGAAVPTFSGRGLKERILVECWKRLPIGVSRYLGPRVRAWIPA